MRIVTNVLRINEAGDCRVNLGESLQDLSRLFACYVVFLQEKLPKRSGTRMQCGRANGVSEEVFGGGVIVHSLFFQAIIQIFYILPSH